MSLLQREPVAEQLLAELRRSRLLAAEVVADRAFRRAGVEEAGHQRQEARVGARLEDDRVAPGLDRARLLALERLVGGDLGQLRGVDLADVLDARRARPARAAAVLGAARQDEARLRVLVVGEESLGVRRARRLVRLGDVAGPEHALLLADVEALLDHAGALGRAEVDAARERRVDGDVVLRAFDERQRLGILARLARALLRLLDRRLERLVVELARRGRGRARADVHRDVRLRSYCTMFAVMLEFANRVAERSPPLNSTSTASAFAMLITLSVIALTSSREYIGGKRLAQWRLVHRVQGVEGFGVHRVHRVHGVQLLRAREPPRRTPEPLKPTPEPPEPPSP